MWYWMGEQQQQNNMFIFINMNNLLPGTVDSTEHNQNEEEWKEHQQTMSQYIYQKLIVIF